MTLRHDAMQAPAAKLRVAKLGGSLLSLDFLAERLRAWLASEPAATTVLVVGGGDLADAVRELDRRHSLGEQAAHDLCIQVLGVTARALATLLPEARLAVDASAVCVDGEPGALIIFDVGPFMAADALRADRLPATWQVTTDSIAAWLAESLGADELVLLKSAAPAIDSDIGAWSAEGYVDAWFPQAAARLENIRWVNLRSGASGLAAQHLTSERKQNACVAKT